MRIFINVYNSIGQLMFMHPSMTCDYELGKFTYLDKIEPVIPPNCGRSRIIEIPEIIIDSSDDSPEIIEPKSDSDDCQEIDESEVLFEGVKRKNGCTIDSPTKKLAISESIDSCKKIDNIQVHVTKPPDKELSDKLQKMKNKQILDSNSNTQTNNITPQHKYKEYNDPVHLVAEGQGHPCKWFMCHLQMDFKTIETLLDHVRGKVAVNYTQSDWLRNIIVIKNRVFSIPFNFSEISIS